jgi:hypothetical protein
MVRDGERIQTALDSRAVLKLSDGSEMELAPGSIAQIRGRVGSVRQVVELVHGKATFRVREAPRQFRVETEVGSVTVLGTEFSVELRPQQRRGGEEMNRGMVLAMAVAVTMGSVDVEVGGKHYTLSAGMSQAFAEDGDRGGPRLRRASGTITAADSGSVTVERRGDRGISSESFSITADTTILVESDETETVPGEGGKTRQRRKLVPGTTADLVVGKRADIWATPGVASRIVVRAPRPKREGGGEREREGDGAPRPPRRGGGEGDREGGDGGGEAKRSGGEGDREGKREGEGSKSSSSGSWW